MSKITTIEQAMRNIEDGMTLMIAGFLAVGTPEVLVDALVVQGTKAAYGYCQ
ncbi:coenzyme A transferase [Anaerospora hongkongensis]|uniref:Coenzyme A transferase n=1 Tax=Anaerospora hongkongensis TaxID=244830 RepID=A0A4R1PZU4_9FIRM|nr:CoA-transferase [Anaerospora hongkongensis]TCL38685.1 coenzyme A transferase [Anaerospora hongkongensis]